MPALQPGPPASPRDVRVPHRLMVDFDDTSWRGLARRVVFVARVWYRHSAARKWWRRHVTTRRLARISGPLFGLSASHKKLVRDMVFEVDVGHFDERNAERAGLQDVPIGAPIPVRTAADVLGVIDYSMAPTGVSSLMIAGMHGYRGAFEREQQLQRQRAMHRAERQASYDRLVDAGLTEARRLSELLSQQDAAIAQARAAIIQSTLRGSVFLSLSDEDDDRVAKILDEHDLFDTH